jgi:predicted PurR-regulated permease PerM
MTHPALKWLVYSLFTFLAFGFIWSIQSVLMPFVVGFVVAYMLHAPTTRLVGCHSLLNRGLVSLLLLLFVMIIIVSCLVLMWPILSFQFQELLKALPHLWSIILKKAQAGAVLFKNNTFTQNIDPLSWLPSEQAITKRLMSFLNHMLINVQNLFHLVSLCLIVPFVAFYALKDWPIICTRLKNLCPLTYQTPFLDITNRIDTTLRAFIYGQSMVSLMLMIFYGITLTAIDLKFSLILSVLIGVLAIIPYLGTIIGLILCLSIAVAQWTSWEGWTLTLGVFILGQLLEGYYLQPKFIGEKVGLHPLWILFALLSGSALWGILGALIAMPLAAVCGVVIGYTLNRCSTNQINS